LARRSETPGVFRSWDGTELFYRAWPSQASTEKALIVLHRGHEHSGRVTQLVEALDLPECHAFSYDMRGHGQSPGARGQAAGYDVWVRDLDAFVNHVRDRHGIDPANMAILANSVGAVNAVTWVHDYGVRVRCLVLAAPAFRIRLYVPLAIPLLRLLVRLKPGASIRSYVRADMLTHDRAEVASYEGDPLITRDIAVSVLLGMHDATSRVLEDAAAVATPTLVLSAGRDFVVANEAQDRFVAGVSSARKELVRYPGQYHAILYETNRGAVLAKAREFIQSSLAGDAGSDPAATAGDACTWREYERLRSSASLPGRILFGAQVLAMKSMGRLSRGIALGWRTGFNSGESLDHVYRNRAEGTTVVGRWMDRAYLNAVGWRGIRVRKQHLQQWVRHAAGVLRAEGRPVRVMDVASGPGRYLLELQREDGGMELLLRDREAANLAAASRLAAELGLGAVRFEQADAFDPGSYRGGGFRPTVVVVSGLYELFPDNDRVRTSLLGIVESLAPGGFLVYTGQPWHPQLEMIARTLVGGDGKPWVMRRRTQRELNALVEAAGFRRVGSLIDSYGIFTVTLARKVRE
jgi:alpha-beta hydrolase superfamily lysophospholipase/SAM-dependent methyltransferase